MKVRVVRSFVSRTPKTGKVFHAVEGQILDRSELPKGNDFLKCGFIVPVREGAERAVKPKGEKAVKIEDRSSSTTGKKKK